MKNLFFAVLVVVLAIPPHIDASPPDQKAPPITRYLPETSGLVQWSASGDPQIASGEDLYLLIDGGAEIFLEYGFEEAVIQSYTGGNGRSINLEIYKMDNPTSAYGIYTFRTGEGGEAVPIGSDGCIEDYYLNFWKGSVLATVIGFDTCEVTRYGIISIAKAVEARIEEDGDRPRLTGLLPPDGLNTNGIEYLKGNLALYNNYEFDSADIFGLSEGVIGTYADYRIFLFSYTDEAECRKWFQNGADHLENSPRFRELTRYRNGFTMRDKKGNYLRSEHYRNFIILLLGSKEITRDPLSKQKILIDQYEH
ncbi:MAG: hypothetical protein JSV33_01875 [bacterium]|nr:MAG: hypothetical protein JSV33_01875 [bacterium]